MKFKNIKTEVLPGQVGLITLDRPEKRNSWTWVVGQEIEEAIYMFNQDDQVRAIVITGNPAGRAFCAGADLGQGVKTFDFGANPIPEKSSEAARAGANNKANISNGRTTEEQSRKPIIGAINGAAVGVGITMTLGYDMRIVAEDAKIGFVFVQRGIVPEAGSTWYLPRLVGLAKANELLLTGHVYKAIELANTGLFNYVVPADQVLPKAIELARRFAFTAPVSVAIAREMIKNSSTISLKRARLEESVNLTWTGKQSDAKEGVKSFLEKRPPSWTMSIANDKDMPHYINAITKRTNAELVQMLKEEAEAEPKKTSKL